MVIKSKLMDGDGIARALTRLAHEVIEKNKGTENLVLVGIRTRGVPVAERVGRLIEKVDGRILPLGKLDITLYRDDLTTIAVDPVFSGSEIDFDIDGKDVILCDDVLYTARTVRAAIDALMESGRPKSIQLLVLVDRGHRELPFRADYVGKNVPTSRKEVVLVRFAETDGGDEVLLAER